MSKPKVDLYYHPVSFYSQKARLFLLEKEVDLGLHVIDFHGKDEHLTDDFLRMNPEGNVPVVVVDGRAIPDSDAIFRECDSLAGPSLAPADIAEAVWRLHARLHALRVEIITYGAVLHKPYSDQVRVPGPLKAQVRERVYDDEGRRRKLGRRLATAAPDVKALIEKKMAMWDERARQMRSEEEMGASMSELEAALEDCERQLSLSGGPFLFGARFTAADIDLAVLLYRLHFLGMGDLAMRRRLAVGGFWAAVGRRASFRAVQADFRGALMRAVLASGRLLLAVGVVAVLAAGVAIVWRRWR